MWPSKSLVANSKCFIFFVWAFSYHFTSQTQIEDGRRQVALNHTLYKGPYLGPDYGMFVY